LLPVGLPTADADDDDECRGDCLLLLTDSVVGDDATATLVLDDRCSRAAWSSCLWRLVRTGAAAVGDDDAEEARAPRTGRGRVRGSAVVMGDGAESSHESSGSRSVAGVDALEKAGDNDDDDNNSEWEPYDDEDDVESECWRC
jgi:hypothetical protein